MWSTFCTKKPPKTKKQFTCGSIPLGSTARTQTTNRIMVHKRCAWATCKSKTWYPKRISNGVYFVPLLKLKQSMDKCLCWMKLCGRPHSELNLTAIYKTMVLYCVSNPFTQVNINHKRFSGDKEKTKILYRT